MRNFIATALLVLFIPVVLIAGMFVWAFYSTPAVVMQAHNREAKHSTPALSLAEVPVSQQQMIRAARPVSEAVAEVLFFYPEYRPNAFHRFQRAIFGSALSKDLSADEQLQIYINHADFGTMQGPTGATKIVGFPAAAQAYFDKPLQNLDPEQLQALLDSLQHKSIQSTP